MAEDRAVPAELSEKVEFWVEFEIDLGSVWNESGSPWEIAGDVLDALGEFLNGS